MLEKVLQHNSLGSQSQILYVLDLLSKNNPTVANLQQVCVSTEYTFATSFQGMINLLQWLDIIKINSLVQLHNNLDKENFLENFYTRLFLKLSDEKELHNFLNNNNIIFDKVEKSIFIKNNAIKFKFSALRNLLINLGLFMKDDLIQNQFIIYKDFSPWFFETAIPFIEKSQTSNSPLVDLIDMQKRQEEHGVEAEDYVLRYEKNKRNNHPLCQKIQIISSIDVKAGYDIKSYKTDESIMLDKFIEVKSYSERPYFYWTKNEITVAKREQDNYFLYLVDRDKINDAGYEPTIIQNPYKNITDKEWEKECQSWTFNQLNST